MEEEKVTPTLPLQATTGTQQQGITNYSEIKISGEQPVKPLITSITEEAEA